MIDYLIPRNSLDAPTIGPLHKINIISGCIEGFCWDYNYPSIKLQHIKIIIIPKPEMHYTNYSKAIETEITTILDYLNLFILTQSIEIIHTAISLLDYNGFRFFRLEKREEQNDQIRCISYKPEVLQAAIETNLEIR